MKELLSLGKVVDLKKNKTDKGKRSQIYSLILLGRKLKNLLCRRLKTEELSIRRVQQTGTKNVGIGSLKSA